MTSVAIGMTQFVATASCADVMCVLGIVLAAAMFVSLVHNVSYGYMQQVGVRPQNNHQRVDSWTAAAAEQGTSASAYQIGTQSPTLCMALCDVDFQAGCLLALWQLSQFLVQPHMWKMVTCSAATRGSWHHHQCCDVRCKVLRGFLCSSSSVCSSSGASCGCDQVDWGELLTASLAETWPMAT